MKRNVLRETLIRLSEEDGWIIERDRAVARNLLALNAPIDMITQATGLTEEAWRAKRDAFREALTKLAEEEGLFAERDRAAGQTTTQTTNYASALNIARNLLTLNTPIDIITRATGLTADEIHGQA